MARDGKFEISNNCVGKKYQAVCDGAQKFSLANTPFRAKGSTTIFSLIETARENGLDPYRYLTWVFQTVIES